MTNRALSVRPGEAGSVRLEQTPDEQPEPSTCTVETLLVGVCGTDGEIVAGTYGTAPPGRSRLVVGHEALCRVVRAAPEATLDVGDLVVPIVRRPDPVPCPSCAVGEWDMCQNGRYTEHGIHGADGFCRDRFHLDPSYAVSVPAGLGDAAVLVEPASIIAKAWEQIERIGARAHWAPRRVLVTGAGPIGLLAALFARQRGYETHVVDLVTSGPKPQLVHDLGAMYHCDALRDTGASPDIVVECTGIGSVVVDALEHAGPTGIVCLAGISTGSRAIDLDMADINRRLVLENNVVFGTVNANRRHYESAVSALTQADSAWVRRLISRQVPVDRWADAFAKQPGDVKVVIRLGPGPAQAT